MTGPAAATTQVDCDTEDDFCTGDPCTTSDKLEVTASPCTLDFGTRTLVITKPIILPNAAQLSLSAGAIEVRGRIIGRQLGGGGEGADVSLTTSGNISTFTGVNVSASTVPGSIQLQAGGNVELRGQLRAAARGSTGSAIGGTVSVAADGTVSSTRRGKIDVRGKTKETQGGQVSVTGDSGVALGGKVDARGSAGGIATISSTAGDVAVEQQVRVEGEPGVGGTLLVSADDQLTFGRKAKTFATGTTNGGCIRLSGTNGVTVNSKLQARGRNGDGGIVVIASTSGDVVVEKNVIVRGSGTGGTIDFSGSGVILRKVYHVTGNPGGIIEAEASLVDASQARFRAKTNGSVQLCGATVLPGTSNVPIGSTCTPGAPVCP